MINLSKPDVFWWTLETSCLLMDPMTFKSLGPSKDMSFLCTHVFWWTQKPHVYWWTQKIIKGPSNNMRFWVHYYTWGFGRIVGPSKNMRFWEGKTLKTLINLMCFDEPNGSIKTHEILEGENLDLGPSNHMSFLGPSNHMRWWKMGKIWLGPSNHMSAQSPV